MKGLLSNLRAEVQALTFPLRRKTRNRLHALANDALAQVSRPPHFEESFAEQWRRILAASGDVLEAMPPAGSPRILFGSMFGQICITRPVEATFAMALRLRGATSMILACDESLPACEWNPFGNNEPDPGPHGSGQWHFAKHHTCQTCIVKLNESYTLPGLDRRSVSDYTRPGDSTLAQELSRHATIAGLRDVVHKDINVGEHAYSALCRATLRGRPLDDERTLWMARRYLAASIQLVEAGERVFADLKPDAYVAADGIYVLAGTMCELARKLGIHVIVHGPPYRKGTVWLSHDDTNHRLLISERNERWKKFEMTPERTRVADEYLASKHLVGRDYISYHVDSIQDDAAIRAEVGLDERPIVTLFTNIFWDSQLYYRFKVFPDMLVWLFETIRFYEKRTDMQLVIRLHPAEMRGVWPTNQPLYPEIQKEFPTLPANVKIVKPESKVSSYALGAMSRVALIYGARVGTELVMLGTPVIVAGEAFMRGKGFSYDPTTVDGYFSLLEQGAGLPRPTEEQRDQARKWYYHYFFRLMLPYPFYEGDRTANGHVRGRLTFESLRDILPGKSAVLDRICEGIADRRLPFEWDEISGRPVEAD